MLSVELSEQALEPPTFGKRLGALRRERKLTQQKLCEQIGVHLSQLKNYENDRSQPTLDVIRKMALALDVTADEIVFDKAERLSLTHLTDKDFDRQWKEVENFPDEDKYLVSKLLHAMIVKQRVEQAVR